VLSHSMPVTPEGFGDRGLYGKAELAYFILGDKLGTGLEGGTIMQDRLSGEYSQYSVWQITIRCFDSCHTTPKLVLRGGLAITGLDSAFFSL
jgi:hypothetical protein